MADIIPHWIDGKPQDGQSGRTGPVYDPATGRETARVAYASLEEADKAVAAAKQSRNSTLVSIVLKLAGIFGMSDLLEGRSGRCEGEDLG